MISTLFYILAIWTGMSLSIGIVWVTLCFGYDSFEAFAFAARQTLAYPRRDMMDVPRPSIVAPPR